MLEGKKIIVTGGAGFIGSHLVDKLVAKGAKVCVIDDLSLGKKEYIARHEGKNGFEFHKKDLKDFDSVKPIFAGANAVFHLAANSDIANSFSHPRTDLDAGTVATFNVLESMRQNGVSKIIFSSSSAIYGDPVNLPLHEDDGPLLPVSLYGASKLAAEGLISAYHGTFDFSYWIYRFANITGDRATHGVIYDFEKKLLKNPKELEILGDGKQCKSYVHVDDCVDAMLFGYEHSKEKTNVFNIANDGWTSVRRIAEITVATCGFSEAKFKFTGGARGWPGDVPKVLLAGERLAKLGWKPKLTSDGAVEKSAAQVWKEIKGRD